MKIPFLSFDRINDQIKVETLEFVESFLDSKAYILGGQVNTFEKEYARFSTTDFCVGVSNGLDALKLSLLALNIGVGDEVIVPSNTYIASALAVSHVGATPVLVEPNIRTYNIDVTKIEAKITAKTKAILPVHLYGQACEMDKVMSIAKKYNLYVVEDNAQAQGASYQGKMTGSFGEVNATSFYPTKNLGALGDAGAITTDNEELASKIQALRSYGSTVKNKHEVIGYNARLDELQAGVLNVKFQYLERWTAERQQIASWYKEALSNCEGIILPFIIGESTSVFHLYTIRTNNRDELQEYLNTKGIETLAHYPIPLHLQDAYKELNHKKGDFPIAEELSNTMLSLPLFIGMKKEEVELVAQEIKMFCNKNVKKEDVR